MCLVRSSQPQCELHVCLVPVSLCVQIQYICCISRNLSKKNSMSVSDRSLRIWNSSLWSIAMRRPLNPNTYTSIIACLMEGIPNSHPSMAAYFLSDGFVNLLSTRHFMVARRGSCSALAMTTHQEEHYAINRPVGGLTCTKKNTMPSTNQSVA